MSAIARFFHQRGDQVCGYDRTPSPLTAQLEAEGISIHYDDDPTKIPSNLDMAIYTPAVPSDTAIMTSIRNSNVPLKKRSQVLGELTRGRKCVAVAGTHGKTTTSSMIAWLLHQSHIGCSAFLGGISKNLDSNMVVNLKSEYVVVEADEYDRSFLQLNPHYSVITATDADHLDIYGTHENMLATFAQYANQTQEGGFLLIKQNASIFEHPEITKNMFKGAMTHHTYSATDSNAGYYYSNIINDAGNITFDLHTPNGVYKQIQLTNSCLYNVENAVAASAIALACGITEDELRTGLKSFSGIRRRFDYRVKNNHIIYIDDYAHHPEEIKATLDSVRFLFPERKVMGIFQPHLYSRTQDFADGFAEVLSTLDEVALMNIYPARELPIPGVTSQMVLDKINNPNKQLLQPNEVVDAIKHNQPDVVLTIGAGDIDRIVPEIEKALS